MRAWALRLGWFASVAFPVAGGAQEAKTAAEVAEAYLRCIAVRDFAGAAVYVDSDSLTKVKADQIRAAESIANDRHREDFLRQFGCASIDELKELTLVEAFVAGSNAQNQQGLEDPELNQQVANTLKFRHLGTVDEGESLAHVLLRHTHERDDRIVVLFDMLSLVNQDGKWRISLTAQEPLFTDIEADKEGEADSGE